MPLSFAVFKMNLVASVRARIFSFSRFGKTDSFSRRFMRFYLSQFKSTLSLLLFILIAD
jgi:hypothetical protein